MGIHPLTLSKFLCESKPGSHEESSDKPAYARGAWDDDWEDEEDLDEDEY